MKSFIRKLVKEALNVREAEFDKAGHTVQRIKQRIQSISDEDLPFEVKERVFYNLDKIANADFSNKKDFTVMLGAFRPNPNSELYMTDEEGNGYYSIIGHEGGLIKDSTGNQFWMIVRGNIIKTFFLRKDWQTKNPNYNADKLQVDYSFKNIDQAINTLGKGVNKQQPQPKTDKVKPIVNINGTKWVVNPKDETLFMKNKPAKVHKIEDVLDELPEKTQEDILAFL